MYCIMIDVSYLHGKTQEVEEKLMHSRKRAIKTNRAF
jgi:hypothetical protein